MLNEEFNNGFDYDTLLGWCQNKHLRELIENKKDTIITMLGGLKT